VKKEEEDEDEEEDERHGFSKELLERLRLQTVLRSIIGDH